MEKDIAIMMADLTGYTTMTDAHGGASAARIVRKYMELVDNALVGNSKVIQRIGDQVVIIGDNATDVLLTAQELNKVTRDEHHFLSIHAGLHFGEVFIEGNNLYGSTVNVAARIMNIAQGGEILCSKNFVSRLPERSTFEAVGEHKLKNLVEPIELFRFSVPATLLLDPVCHMQVRSAGSPYTFTFDNTTYHFCSPHCRDRFAGSPETFVPNPNISPKTK